MIFLQNRKLKFNIKQLSESTKEIINPSRGWYEIYSFSIVQKADFEELKWCLRKNQTIALVIIDLSKAADVNLNAQCLENMDMLLKFFAENKKDIILRLTYDREGKGMEKEPSTFSQILHHIEQLKEILAKYKKNIFVYQGFLVGSWGEMHDSAYLSENDLKALAEYFFRSIGRESYFSVRKPQQWRMLFEENATFDNIQYNLEAFRLSTGLFDDGIFGSESHLGTFGITDRKDAAWKEAWSRKDELEFESVICENAPNGGEAVYGEEVEIAAVISRLKNMKITYLNCAYDKKILNKWKEQTVKTNDLWNGMNGYDYIARHLGYRIVIDGIILKKKKNVIEAEIKFYNTGFAPLYDAVFFELQLENEKYMSKTLIAKYDFNEKIQPDKNYKIKMNFPICNGAMYITMKRKKDCRTIIFANCGSNEEGLYFAEIKAC